MSSSFTPPGSWSVVELESIVDVSYGKALSAGMRSEAGDVPVVGSSGIVGRHDQALVDGPCLVVGRKGAAGMVHLVKESSWPIDTAYFIQPPHSVDLRYLYHFLDSQQLVQLDKSTAIPSLSRDDLYKVEVPIPSSAEQTRIIEKLEELLSDLDAGVAELKAAQRKLAQYRQSLLKAAVEGALTADWRAAQSASSRRKPGSSRSKDDRDRKRDPGLRRDDEAQETGAELLQRILHERRARWEQKQLAKFAEQGKTPPKGWQDKYPEPRDPNLTDLPLLPESWVWTSIDQLSPEDLANGRSVPTAEVGAKVLRLTAVREGRIDLNEWKHGAWSEEQAQPFAVAEGDLLIVRGNGSLSLVGRAGLVGPVRGQTAYPDTLIRLRTLDAIVRPKWISLVWDSDLSRTHFERRARTSAGIYKISQPDIVSVAVPVPPIAEQDRILEEFESHQEQIASTTRVLTVVIKQAAAQRKNILKAAFSGQLVPQDPNDEPASELLARIRAAREQVPTARSKGRRAGSNPAPATHAHASSRKPRKAKERS